MYITFFGAVRLLCHIGVNFRSGDGQQKTNSENSIAETKAEHTGANVDPFKGFAFHMWLGMQLFRLNDFVAPVQNSFLLRVCQPWGGPP